MIRSQASRFITGYDVEYPYPAYVRDAYRDGANYTGEIVRYQIQRAASEPFRVIRLISLLMFVHLHP
jgi:hypothetical protein